MSSDPIVFIGPGSEWFWSAVSGIIVAATFLVIYRQLSAQRSASLYEQTAAWGREWNEEMFSVTRLQVLIEIEGRPVEQGIPIVFGDVGDYFERLGYLVRHRHVRAEDVWNDLRYVIGQWWALIEPYLVATRKESGNPLLFEYFESLERTMDALDQGKLGRSLTFDTTDESVLSSIEGLRRRLQRFANARNGIFPEPREPAAASSDPLEGAPTS